MKFTEAELAERRTGLGASEAAASVGLSPWKTQLQLFMEKMGSEVVADPDTEEELALHLEMGIALEPVALSRFTFRTKFQVTDRQRKVVDPQWPRRWVTLDGISSDMGLVEAKSTGFASPDDWGDPLEDGSVPMQYLLQCQHGMACTGLEHAWMPLIITNRQFRLYRIQRDEELIQLLTRQQRAFWDLVEAKSPPAAVSLEDAKIAWPKDAKGTKAKITPETLEALQRHHRVRANIKQFEAEKEELELAVKSVMGTISELVDVTGAPLVTWRQNKASNVFDVDKFAFEHPTLYPKYLKERAGARPFLNKLKGDCLHPHAVAWVRAIDGASGKFCPDCNRNIEIITLQETENS
ncbi:MAG TPA: YqaJ viral recombinase family protein [Steroidobacteraceae bacterium]|jgi:putative phage-type endonuclease